MFDTNEIGRNLTRLREARGITMDELAARMRWRGYPKWTKIVVFNIEHGTRQLKLGEAADVINCLGYETAALADLLANGSDAALLPYLNKLRDAIVKTLEACNDAHDAYVEAAKAHGKFNESGQLGSTSDSLKFWLAVYCHSPIEDLRTWAKNNIRVKGGRTVEDTDAISDSHGGEHGVD